MCSILGFIDFRNKYPHKKESIYRLNKLMNHRGPDDVGFYNDEKISLAFNRLSIIDLNTGNQPIIRNNIISIFNGEIYNFKEIRKELEDKKYKFLTNTDSEIIPYAYKEWGIEFVKKLSGMFSIALYDKPLNKFYLIRDRVGIKPLYFSYLDEAIIFSSETKSIINFPKFEKKINMSAIYSYLSFRYTTNNNENFFKNIHRVNPGHLLEINLNSQKISQIPYWEISFQNNNEELSENYYLEKLDYLLNNSVKTHLQSDVPIGVFLSGGLDSSLLSAIASRHHSGKLKTYSVGFKETKYNEGNKANNISKYLDTDHTEIIIEKKDFFANLENIVNIKSAPISIPHEYPLYALAKRMKKDITVVLSGEGADEFFGGYSRVQKSPFDYKKGKIISNLINSNTIKKIFAVEEKFNFQENSLLDYFFEKYNWFTFKELNNLFSNESKEEINLKSVTQPWRQAFIKNNNRPYEQILSLFQNNHLQCLLDRLDVMTMANSIEARVPFLDHSVIEFINSVPFKYKIKWKSKFHRFLSLFSKSSKYSEQNDTNKFLLRKCASKYLPLNAAKEKKLGFPLPMNDWMKDDKIKEILLDGVTSKRHLFNKDQLERLLNLENNINDPFDFSGKKVWMLVNLEIWMRNFID